jgi:ATP/maltotriose-dependent transcriptional regulator MalT
MVTAQCLLHLGQLARAEQEFVEGIELSESIGEHRVTALMKSNLAVAQAMLNRPDEALETALENMDETGPNSLLYSRFEALRCLAEVRYRRALAESPRVTSATSAQSPGSINQSEMDEAERICAAADELVSPTESYVSQLWLGPLHIKVLMAQGKRAEAREKLSKYQQLVSQCQSPRFTSEAAGLAKELGMVASGA